jgi:hypothetical protein
MNITIKTLHVYGIVEAANASRLSHQSIGDEGGEKDIVLLSKLVKSGDEHAKSLRGIMVWCEIDAPRYWWHEMVTYRMGCEQLGSESTMHGQPLRFNKCVRESTQILVNAIEDLHDRKSNLPEGTLQRRIFAINYQALRRIYMQRRYHKLVEWSIFCDWIKTLPFAKDLIMIERLI